jgi:hypothetical protein
VAWGVTKLGFHSLLWAAMDIFSCVTICLCINTEWISFLLSVAILIMCAPYVLLSPYFNKCDEFVVSSMNRHFNIFHHPKPSSGLLG